MAELITAVNELLKGKRVEENLGVYSEGISSLYKSIAYLKLSMNYHVFSEVYEEIEESKKQVIQPVVGQIQELMGQLVNMKTVDGQSADMAKGIRARLVNIMEILTAYVDRFQIYEYILNRVEYKFKPAVYDNTYYNSQLERDIERYVLSDRDNAVINMKISQIVSQVPMRLSRGKFFDILENSLSLYKGSECSSVDDFVYMIKTAGTLYKPKGFDSEFQELIAAEKELSEINYENLDAEGYNTVRFKLDSITSLVEEYSDACVMLTEVINDLYSIILCADARAEDEELNEIIRKIIAEDYLVVCGKTGRSNDIENLLEKLEGQQERISHKLYTPDSTLEEIESINYETIIRMGVKEDFERLKTVSRLQSASTFALLDVSSVNTDTADEAYVADAANKLMVEFTELFENTDRLSRRAVMASVMGNLPVFFNNFDEFKEYVHVALMQCGDEAEKQACMVLVNMMVTGD